MTCGNDSSFFFFSSSHSRHCFLLLTAQVLGTEAKDFPGLEESEYEWMMIKGSGRMTLIFFFWHVQSHFLLLQLNKYNEAALFHPVLPQAFSMSAMLVWVIWRIWACKIKKNILVSQSHAAQKCLNARKKKETLLYFWTAFYVVSKEHFITVGAGFNERVRQRQGDVSQGRPAKEKRWSLDWLIESKCTVPDNKAAEKWHATFFPIMELREADRPHRRTSIIAVNLRHHLSCYISVSYVCSL